MKTSCVIALLVLAIIQISHADKKPTVTLPHGGSLVGTTMKTVGGRKVDAFLGVPYAEPPIGPLRFKSPLPIRPWEGSKSAKSPPPACPQANIYGDDSVPFGNEDCLYVNVYVPRDRTKRNLPVMVWIHGLLYNSGTSDPAILGPDLILDNDVVLVTFNYRLGALGFLSTGTLDAPGNYGLKDQLLLLQWVKENIKSFGGDPKDVTLAGQSTGSASVSLHMVARKSKGLFHKAIMQAGTSFNSWALVDRSTAIKYTKDVGELVGCPLENEDYERMISCLTEVPAFDLVDAVASFKIAEVYNPYTVFGAVVEPDTSDAFLPDDPRNVIDPHGDSIPLLIGRNSDEAVFTSAFILNQQDAHFKDNFYQLLPKLLQYDHKPESIQKTITKRIDKFYFKGRHDWSKSNHYKLTDLFTDRLITSGIDQFLRNRFSTMRRPVPKTFVYVFSHRGPTSVTQSLGGGPDFYGVCHGDELQFLFPLNQLNVPGTDADKIMRKAMPKMWTDFVIKGDPTRRDTNIRQYWKPSNDFPLRFVKIGSKYNTDQYFDGSFKFLASSQNITVARDTAFTEFSSNQSETNIRRHFEDNKSSAGNGNTSDDNKTSESVESKTKRYNILRNRKGLDEKRMKFWRSLERLLY